MYSVPYPSGTFDLLLNLVAESSVLVFWCSHSHLIDRTNTLGAYLITPAMGSHFVMYLANMQGLFIFSCHFLFFLLFSDLNFDVIFTSDVYVLLFSCASVTVVKVWAVSYFLHFQSWAHGKFQHDLYSMYCHLSGIHVLCQVHIIRMTSQLVAYPECIYLPANISLYTVQKMPDQLFSLMM